MNIYQKFLQKRPFQNPDEALQKAYDLVGKDASVVVIPDGVAVLAVKEGQA